ncbi:MAG: UDP-N-acetylmuramate dehydrogenase [Solobacterium sp.]|nr:UDP-N-acetylmuramate dehydrogenase [Solobacterium sp.]
MDELLTELQQYGTAECNVPFSAMTTLRIGGNARYVFYPDSDVALDAVIRMLNERNVSYKMLGKGSDLLCSDDDYDGVVIRLDRHFNDMYFDGCEVTVQAGASLIALAVAAMQRGLSGMEFASGIPGTVGGAVYMNAGAYKSCMGDIVREIFVYRDSRLEWIPAEICGFAYRSSIFQEHPDWIILAVKIMLSEKNKDEIAQLMEDRRKRRFASQPLEFPSCGSVFRNPEGRNAWELIDGIGYRGRRIGDAEVSTKHCNFIVNRGHATAEEYITLVREIQDEVRKKYGIELHTEMEMFNWH